ncbi:hypothetical protein FRB99_006376 [Tulasnella sp. 403]|nr:hypothetical protein FRB99_006376 [Tulasnella sp. 403]
MTSPSWQVAVSTVGAVHFINALNLSSPLPVRFPCPSTPNALAWAASSNTLFVASAIGIQRLSPDNYEWTTIVKTNAADDAIACMVVKEDGTAVIYAAGTKVYVWDVEKKKLSHTLSGHNARITSLSLSSDGLTVASLSATACCTHELASGSKSGLRGVPPDASIVSFHPRRSNQVFVLGSRTIHVYDLLASSSPSKRIPMPAIVSPVAITHAPHIPNLVAVACKTGGLAVLDTDKPSANVVIELSLKTQITSCTFVKGQYIVCGSENGRIHEINLKATSQIKSSPLDSHGARIVTMTLTKPRSRNVKERKVSESTHTGSVVSERENPDTRRPSKIVPLETKTSSTSRKALRDRNFTENQPGDDRDRVVDKPEVPRPRSILKTHPAEPGRSVDKDERDVVSRQSQRPRSRPTELPDEAVAGPSKLAPSSSANSLEPAVDRIVQPKRKDNQHKHEASDKTEELRRTASDTIMPSGPGPSAPRRVVSDTHKRSLKGNKDSKAPDSEAKPNETALLPHPSTSAHSRVERRARLRSQTEELDGDVIQETNVRPTATRQSSSLLLSPSKNEVIVSPVRALPPSTPQAKPSSTTQHLVPPHVYPTETAVQLSPLRKSIALPSPYRMSRQDMSGTDRTGVDAHERFRAIIRDVMMEIRQEERRDMVALHMDIVRAGRTWKNELRSLMSEYMDTLHDLQEENARLRRENDLLRRGF